MTRRKLDPALLCRLIIDLELTGEEIDGMSRDENNYQNWTPAAWA